MGANDWAKHGIMARANCSAGSPYAYVTDQQNADLTSPIGTNIQWRLSQGIGADYDWDNEKGHGDVLRLERRGSTFSGAYEDALGEWISVGSIEGEE